MAASYHPQDGPSQLPGMLPVVACRVSVNAPITCLDRLINAPSGSLNRCRVLYAAVNASELKCVVAFLSRLCHARDEMRGS